MSIGEESAKALGWRFGGGVDFTFHRGEKNEFALRVDYCRTSSESARIGGVDASWAGNAILGELLWISTP